MPYPAWVGRWCETSGFCGLDLHGPSREQKAVWQAGRMMDMDYRRYIVEATAVSDHALDDWRWLVGSQLQLWCITKAGDAFLRDPVDGSVYFLDVLAGKAERIADGESAFEKAVNLPENADRWLMPEIVDGQALLVMKPGKDECLSFKLPPVIGGQIEPDNYETCSVLVHFSLAGQIHQQVKDLPAGTKISKFKVINQKADCQRPWWKFW
jgi:hypothetical protein